ncbi:MAG: TetR family transcriptional regulator [Rhizobiales bacterium]|nr:TetR family transcriptional regulator [Hyphomicrobiales bacterium]
MAYRRTDQVSARLAQTRRQILNSAREIISELGFSGAQMSDVAQRSGVATGTLYRYFANKEELCRQVFREVSTREMNMLATIASSDAPPEERLAKVLRTFAGRAIQGRRLAYALLAEPVDVGLAEERSRFRRTHAEIFAGILEEGVASGAFRLCDVRLSAACMAGAIPTVLIGSLAPDAEALETDAERIVDEIVAFCFSGVSHPDTRTFQTREERAAS